MAISDLYVTLSEILEECGVTAVQYDNALGCVKKSSLYYVNEKPCEENIGPYNTVILNL